MCIRDSQYRVQKITSENRESKTFLFSSYIFPYVLCLNICLFVMFYKQSLYKKVLSFLINHRIRLIQDCLSVTYCNHIVISSFIGRFSIQFRLSIQIHMHQFWLTDILTVWSEYQKVSSGCGTKTPVRIIKNQTGVNRFLFQSHNPKLPECQVTVLFRN